MTRALTGPALAVLALLAGGAPGAAHAAKADAFAGKVEPVSGQLYVKKGRLELTPMVDLTLNDPFFTKTMGGARLAYHLTDSLSISAQYLARLKASATGSAVTCTATQGCTDATTAQLYQVPGYLQSIAGGEIAFTPVYAKLNLFAEKVLHIDFSALVGGDYITYRQVLSAQQASAGVKPGDESTVGYHVGLGMRIFLTQAIALNLDVKEYMYAVKVPNVVSGSGSSTDWQFQLAAGLGVSVFFPFHNRASP